MKKIYFTLILYIFSFGFSYAQVSADTVLVGGSDVIIFRDGTVVRAKIIEIQQALIKYKKAEYLNGPTYNANRSDIYVINYPTGKSDYFVNVDSTSYSPEKANQPGKMVINKSEYFDLVEQAKKADKKSYIKVGKTGLSLRLSGGLNYMYGSDNSDNKTFGANRLSWYGEGMLGYVIDSENRNFATVVGAFVQIGNTGENNIERMLADAQVTELPATETGQNLYYNLEFGTILFETIRLSSGTGFQRFDNLAGNKSSAFYYSTTTGLQLDLPYVKLSVDLNFMYGRDFKQTVLRPLAGVILKL